MGTRLQAFVLATAALGCGCGCGIFFEPKPDLEHKKDVEVAGITVQYPGNWKTELESETIEGTEFSSLTIESSGSAIAMVQVFQPGVQLSAQEVFDSYVEGMLAASKDEFGGVLELKFRDASHFNRDVLGTTWEGKTAELDLSLLGESVPHRIRTLHRNGDAATIIIVAQAPVEDWTTIAPGFDAIYDGLSE